MQGACHTEKGAFKVYTIAKSPMKGGWCRPVAIERKHLSTNADFFPQSRANETNFNKSTKVLMPRW